MRDKVKVKLKNADTGKDVIEQQVGDDLYRKTGKWNQLERYFNHQNPSDPTSYCETIRDGETREVIHHCVEPLRDHIGHGSPKPKQAAKKGA